MIIKKIPIQVVSQPVQFISLNHRISLGNGVTPWGLEIECALVLLWVTMSPAKGTPALASEPRQPHLLVAAHAPVRHLWLRFIATANTYITERKRTWRGGGRTARCIQKGKRRRSILLQQFRVERHIHGRFSRGLLLFFNAQVPVALRAKVHRCCGAEETTPVGAEYGLRWLKACFIVCFVLRTHLSLSQSGSFKTKKKED